MNIDFDYIKIIVTVLLAVTGWIIVHYYTNKRTVASKQRDLVTEYLVNSYRVLANEISHRQPSDDRNKKLEELIADIQLFGNEKQIEMIKKLATECSKGTNFDLDPLMNNLRNDLRSRLNLSSITGNVQWLRTNN